MVPLIIWDIFPTIIAEHNRNDIFVAHPKVARVSRWAAGDLAPGAIRWNVSRKQVLHGVTWWHFSGIKGELSKKRHFQGIILGYGYARA